MTLAFSMKSWYIILANSSHYFTTERRVHDMSKVCAISGKGPLSGNKRSHSMRASRRKWNVNLQKVKVVVDGKPKTLRISARTLKTLKKKNAI